MTKTAKEYAKTPTPAGPVPVPYPNVPDGAMAPGTQPMSFGFEFALAGNVRANDEVPLVPTVDLDDAARGGIDAAHGASDQVIDALPNARVGASVSVNGHEVGYDANTDRGKDNMRRTRDAVEGVAGTGIDLAERVADHEKEGLDKLGDAARTRVDVDDAARDGVRRGHDASDQVIDALPNARVGASVSVNGHEVGYDANTDRGKDNMRHARDAAEGAMGAGIDLAERVADHEKEGLDKLGDASVGLGANAHVDAGVGVDGAHLEVGGGANAGVELGPIGADIEGGASVGVDVGAPDLEDPLAAAQAAWDRVQAQANADVNAAIATAQQLAATAQSVLGAGQAECQQALGHAEQAAQQAAQQAEADVARAEQAARQAHDQAMETAKAMATAARDQAKGMLDGARQQAQHMAQEAARAAQRMFGQAKNAGQDVLDRAQRDFENAIKRAQEKEEKTRKDAKEKLDQAKKRAQERKKKAAARAKRKLRLARQRARRALRAAMRRAKRLVGRARQVVRKAHQRAGQLFTRVQHRFLALGQEPPDVELPDAPEFSIGVDAEAEASAGDAEVEASGEASVAAG